MKGAMVMIQHQLWRQPDAVLPTWRLLCALLLSSLATGAVCQERTTIHPCPTSPRREHIDSQSKFVLWQTVIGTSNGSPVVASGKVFIGTNLDPLAKPNKQEARGVMLCIDSNDGKVLWRALHDKLQIRWNDSPGQGIRSTPFLDGDALYYVSNRGELMCLDVNGFRDGINNGPDRQENATTIIDADVIWKLDMMRDLGVYKRDAGDIGNPLPSPVVAGATVFCVTCNGATIGKVPKPDAPSFIAVDKRVGAVHWKDASPGDDIMFGQWSAPVFAEIDGQSQVVFPGGDGVLYVFDAQAGKLIWKLDCNDPIATRWTQESLGTREYFVAAPIVRGKILYASLNTFWEDGPRVKSPVMAIDLGKRGILWKFDDGEFSGTFGSVAVADGLAFALGESGILIALDAQTGQELWRFDLEGGPPDYASPHVSDGKIFVPVDNRVVVLSASKTRERLFEYVFSDFVTGTPMVVNERLFVATRGRIWCLKIDDLAPPSP